MDIFRAAAAAFVAALLLSGCLGVESQVQEPPVGGGAPQVGQESAAPVDLPAGEVYGEGVTLGASTPISEILDNVDAFAGETVRVEGLVTAVCEHRGCWIDLAGDREFETLRIKVEDGVIVFPMEARGKYAVAEGVVTKLEPGMPQGEGQHRGEGKDEHREGEGQGEHSYGEGMTVRIDATGAVIRDQP